jgi:hypothetical protein
MFAHYQNTGLEPQLPSAEISQATVQRISRQVKEPYLIASRPFIAQEHHFVVKFAFTLQLSHQVPEQAIAPLSYAGEFPLFQDLPSIGNFFSSRIGEGKPSNVRRYYDEGWVHTDARHFRSCATHLRITSVCNLHYTLDLPMTVPLCSEDACVTGATTTFTLHRSSVFAGSRAFAIQSYGVLFRGITK